MEGLDYPTAGAKLFSLIKLHVSDNDKIVINLDGIDSLPSMFLNTSLGAFIDEFGKEALRSKISFTQITRSQAERLKDYFTRY